MNHEAFGILIEVIFFVAGLVWLLMNWVMFVVDDAPLIAIVGMNFVYLGGIVFLLAWL